MIKSPAYSDVKDNSVFTFITRHEKNLRYEQLSPENRAYNKREQTMFVLNALTFDKRFKEGLTYVEGTIRAYQRDSRVSSLTPFPTNL